VSYTHNTTRCGGPPSLRVVRLGPSVTRRSALTPVRRLVYWSPPLFACSPARRALPFCHRGKCGTTRIKHNQSGRSTERNRGNIEETLYIYIYIYTTDHQRHLPTARTPTVYLSGCPSDGAACTLHTSDVCGRLSLGVRTGTAYRYRRPSTELCCRWIVASTSRASSLRVTVLYMSVSRRACVSVCLRGGE